MVWDDHPSVVPRSVPHWTEFLALLEEPELSTDAGRLLDVVGRCARVSNASTIDELIAVHWHYLGARTTIQAINVLLDRAYQLERPDLAVSLLRRAAWRGIRRNRETWEICIAGAARMGNWTRVRQRYEFSSRSEHLALGEDGWARLLRICLTQQTPTLIYSAEKAQNVSEVAMAGLRNRSVGENRRRGVRSRVSAFVVWAPKLSTELKTRAFVPFDQTAWVTKLLRPDMFPLKTTTLAVSILLLSAQGKADRVDAVVANWLAERSAQSRSGSRDVR